MADVVRVAAVGVGRLGLLHAKNLASVVPGASLSMVIDSDSKAARLAGETLGVPYSTDLADALGDRAIDAVEICTASDAHADQIVAAAEAGKAIFCEKPIALSLQDADRVLEAVERAGVLLQVGHMRRYDSAYLEARRLITAGEVGRPYMFRSSSLDGAISSSRDFLVRRGGLLIDVALHDFDLARWLMEDEVREVRATGAVLLHEALREVGDVDTAVVTLTFQRGGLGVVQASHAAVYGYDIQTEVSGDKGAVRVGEIRQSDVWRFGSDGRVAHDTVPDFPARFHGAYLAELIDWVACIREGRVPQATGRDARAALAVALAARQSLSGGGAAVTVQ
ncbi:MAG TPA: Gfo/Idh/MocA family oxidoreductase [Chloroflexota bacterium]|nr:Gfo/Idh/MocA family oxidoreductase [Chloroflexota bacterium]